MHTIAISSASQILTAVVVVAATAACDCDFGCYTFISIVSFSSLYSFYMEISTLISDHNAQHTSCYVRLSSVVHGDMLCVSVCVCLVR